MIHTPTRRRGMTLMELIVAVAVLAIMILGFGQIVGQAQRVVTVSQNNMRSNAIAEAINRTIQNDLSKITKNGFLCISQQTETNAWPQLFFLKAGTTRSKTHNVTGLAGVSSYGQADNKHTNDEYGDTLSGLFIRQSWVLSTLSVSGPSDIWNSDLSAIQAKTRDELHDLVGRPGVMDGLRDALPGSLYVPPVEPNDLNALWQVLSAEVNGVSIMWADGTKDGSNLLWYGVGFKDYTTSEGLRDVVWKGGLTQENASFDPSDYSQIEFNVNTTTPSRYRAFWTFHNQNNWPKAIKVSYRILDPTLTESAKESYYTVGGESRYYTRYEVIVPIE